MSAWQPIHTLPPWETALLFSPYDGDGEKTGVIAVGHYSPDHYHPWRAEDGRKQPKLWVLPTHWMLLPSEPAPASPTKEI